MRSLNACAPECPQAADPTGRGRGYMMMVCPMEATVSFRLGTREVTFTTTMLPWNSMTTQAVTQRLPLTGLGEEQGKGEGQTARQHKPSFSASHSQGWGRGKQHDTSCHSVPPTSLGWGRGRGVRQRGKQHDNTSLSTSHITGLGEGQGGQTEGQTAWQHKTSLSASHITGLGEGGQRGKKQS